MAYHRILLKLSGEVLAGQQKLGLDPAAVGALAQEVKQVYELGKEIALVIGGGNFHRGAQGQEVDRTTSDQMGMLATVINALAFKDALAKIGVTAEVFSAVEMERICPTFTKAAALKALKDKKVIICAGGTGNPYFTTDSAAALRASEIEADVLMKATKVDGVYDADPVKNPQAKKFARISFNEVLAKGLRVMDAAAIGLCLERKFDLVVFNLTVPGNIKKAVQGEKVGTVVVHEGK